MDEPSDSRRGVCLVAILRDETRFLHEWIAYHRLLGVDRFFLYDDDPALPLRSFLRAHSEYVTVIDWFDRHHSIPGDNRQKKAYLHSRELIERFRWVVFLDGDEFLVLRKHPHLPAFLAEFAEFGAVVLQWHVFGHNGFYEDPPDLITSSLTRRMREPSPRVKSITKVAALAGIELAHVCDLKPGYSHVDANKRPCTFLPDRTGSPLYPGMSDVAHVNHYMCRSFLTWMKRAQRGDVVFERERAPKEHQWRFTEEDCLRQFVRTVAKNKNEFVDEFMCRYAQEITRSLENLRTEKKPAACINKD